MKKALIREICIGKGLQGTMLDIFKHEVKKTDQDWREIEALYNQVYTAHNIPDTVFEELKAFI